MPVIGHAFAGMATAIALNPSPSRLLRARASLWMPAAVVLAYLPDIVEQVLAPVRDDAALAAHSLLLAPVVSLPIAWALASFFGVSFRRAFALTLFSVAFHDLLDLLQARDRAPFWPLSEWIVDVAVLPAGTRVELAVFGGLFAAFLLGGWLRARVTGGWLVSATLTQGSPALRLVAGSALILLCVVPFGVWRLRSFREDQLDDAHRLVVRGSYREALAVVEHADRWPLAAKSGKLAHIRAEAYLGLGDRERAERHLVRAHEADPHYFWIVADLAVFYSSGNESKATRQSRAQPYLDILLREFGTKEELPRVLARIRENLAEDPLDLHRAGAPDRSELDPPGMKP